LDLRSTRPPIAEIIDLLARRFANKMLFAIQVYEQVVLDSLAALTERVDWSALRTTNSMRQVRNHGLLLLTRGWRPESG